MILTILFLTPVFLIGAICTYTDLKYGKIRNKWLIVGFVWALVLYLSLIFYNYLFLHQAGNLNYLRGMIFNGLLALGLGYVLWNLKLWAAGDAKLFTLFAFLLPPEFYAKTYFSEFPSFVLLINIFIPLLVFLITKALIFISKNIIGSIGRGEWRWPFSVKTLKDFGKQFLKQARVYITFIFIFMILQVLMKEVLSATSVFTSKMSQFYLFLIIFFLFRVFNTFIVKHKSISFGLSVLGFLSCLYLVFSDQVGFLLGSLKTIVIFMVLVGLFQKILNNYIEQREVKKIKSNDAKQGMFLSLHGLSEELKKVLGTPDRGGLSEVQAELIRKLPSSEIKIYRTFALAPFISLGAVLTVLTKDSCLNLLAELLRFLF
jgi:Flp pilus assembly protein protease CpaA